MDEKPPSYVASAREHGLPIRQSANPSKPAAVPGPAPLDLPILEYMRTHRTILASASPRRRGMLTQVLGGPRYGSRLEVIPSTKPEDLDKATLDPHEYVLGTATQKVLDVYANAVELAANIAEGKGPQSSNAPTNEEEEDDEEDDDEQEASANSPSEKKPLNPVKSTPTASATTPTNHDPSRDPDLVIAADTIIVTRDGRILEKPPSPRAHIAMLRLLRDTRVHRVLTAVACLSPRVDAQHPGYELASSVTETSVHFCSENGGLPDDVLESYVRTREGVDKAGGYAVQGLGGMLLVERVDGGVDNVVGLPVRETLRLCEKVVFRQNREEADSSEEEMENEM